MRAIADALQLGAECPFRPCLDPAFPAEGKDPLRLQGRQGVEDLRLGPEVGTPRHLGETSQLPHRTTAVAEPQQQGLGVGETQGVLAGAEHDGAGQPVRGVDAGDEPRPELLAPAQRQRDGVHGPGFEVDRPARQSIRPVRHGHGLGVGGAGGPAHRSEEADGVVLHRVSLKITGDGALVVASAGVSGFPGGGLVQAFGEEPPVLPGHRFAEKRFAGNGPDVRGETSGRFEKHLIVRVPARRAREEFIRRRGQFRVAQPQYLRNRKPRAAQHDVSPQRPSGLSQRDNVLH